MEIRSTGIPSLDYVLGGGVVEGGICEIWGDEQTGKTGAAISTSAQFENVFYYDMDNTFPEKLKRALIPNHDGFHLVSLTSDTNWIQSLNIDYPDGSLVVFDPISVVNPYLVSNYFSRIKRAGRTVILVSHSNSEHESPVESTCAMFCTQRLQFRFVDKIYEGATKHVVGFRTAVKTMKNTVIAPRKTSTMHVYIDIGAK